MRIYPRLNSLLLAALTMLSILTVPSPASAAEEAWEALASGNAVLLMRHATAPGTGDPAGFELKDCATQRNLNQRGRTQAQAWRPMFKKQGIDRARVFSSQWCRCLETARLLDLGPVEAMEPLNSFFAGRGDRDAQTRATIEQVNALPKDRPIVLVSHQVNITALTGIFPASNEALILRLPLTESPKILARLAP